MDEFKVIDRSHPAGMGGTQKVYKFPNGYGASVVQFMGSYGYDAGKWELGVVKWDGDDYKLTYETPITTDVLGHLTWKAVEKHLAKIKSL
jgi:hypothetical protein